MANWLATFLIWAVLAASPPSAAVPKRIVSTAPSITETVYALGAADLLVGVTSFCRFPPEAQQRRIVGDFAAPNLEVILELRPDLVLILDDRQDLATKLAAVGLPFAKLRQNSFREILDSIRQLGVLLGRTAEAEALTARLENRIERLRRRNLQSPNPKPRVFLVISRSPGGVSDLYTAGRSSYLHELLDLAGGRNVFEDIAVPYPKVSVEEVLQRDPDVILDLSREHDHDGPYGGELGVWATFPQLRAVRLRQVRFLADARFVVPGPGLLDAAEELAMTLAGLRNGTR
ncbi:MAG: hypothetical protein Kow00109_24060 [Acidobacteriota bacterium]